MGVNSSVYADAKQRRTRYGHEEDVDKANAVLATCLVAHAYDILVY